MIGERDVHVGEEQLLRLVVDEAEVEAPVREHLSRCPGCRAQRDELAEALSRIGKVAAELAPGFSGEIVLPEREARNFFERPWGWSGLRLGGALVTAAAVVFCVVAVKTEFFHKTAADYADNQEYYSVLSEVDGAQENSLPRVYTEIVGEDSGFNEDFMNFISPSPDDNSV
jgi:hypothetical protein